jgi:hypothetical protein
MFPPLQIDLTNSRFGLFIRNSLIILLESNEVKAKAKHILLLEPY